MISRSIILRNQRETIDFVCMVERYPYSVDISEGHCTMNAKSILGMLAMGFNCVMKMDVHSDNADDLLEAVSKYVCNGLGKARHKQQGKRTEQPPQNHQEGYGYGIASVRRVVEKYSGVVQFTDKGTAFEVSVMLYGIGASAEGSVILRSCSKITCTS